MRCFRALTLISIVAAANGSAVFAADTSKGEWPYYAGTIQATKYSPLAQIDAKNVQSLKIAWQWDNPDNELLSSGATRERSGAFKATPIMIGGVLYTSTALNLVAAVDAGSGKTIWTFDPKAYASGRRPANSSWQHRGVAYWEGKVGGKSEKRIFIATGIGDLIALNAENGEIVKSFGSEGRVDLQAALIRNEDDRRAIGFNSPQLVVGDVIVVGCTVAERPLPNGNPTGHLQAFDARTGERKWLFHTIPQNKEPGAETWENESWKLNGNTNPWSMFSADPELGIVYIPNTTPTNDYYGGARKGSNLYAESLLAINANTGKLVWHFQGVHHGLWDYDFPAAPTLVDITVGGKRIKAVAQVSKQGFTYVFDRATGKPVWPIEERAVPQSIVPGEQASPTQPFPTKPPAFTRQGITENDVMDFTPEMRAEALKVLSEYTYGPLFTPPTVGGEGGKKGTLIQPGAMGGANWGGGGFDPELGFLFVEASNLYSMSVLNPGDTSKGQPAFVVGNTTGPRGPGGLPLTKPPYGTITAIDLNKGEIAWQIPNGEGPTDHPLLKDLKLPPMGASSHTFLSSGGPLVTKSLLFVNQAQVRADGPGISSTEFYMYAYDKKSGARVWQYKLNEPPYGTPMTYQFKGKQYIVVAAGGSGTPARLVAFALP
jgi:quinoprotein glucose dehydrogenase